MSFGMSLLGGTLASIANQLCDLREMTWAL